MPEYSTARIVFPGKEWSEATPETQGISSGKLQQAIDYLQQHSGSDGVWARSYEMAISFIRAIILIRYMGYGR